MAIVLCDTQYREIEELRGISQKGGDMMAGIGLKNTDHQGKLSQSQFYKHRSIEYRCYQRVFLQPRDA